MRNRAAFYIDHIRRQTEVFRDRENDRRESLVDLDRARHPRPSNRHVQGLLNCRYGTKTEHARLDRADTVRGKASHRCRPFFLPKLGRPPP